MSARFRHVISASSSQRSAYAQAYAQTVYRGCSTTTIPKGSVESGRLKSTCFGKFDGEGRDYVVLLPPDYDKTEKLPLLLNLHGGGGNAQGTARTMPMFEGYWASGVLPRCVIATFSTIGGAGFYHDYHNGSIMYHKFFMQEWLPFLRANYGVNEERSHNWLTGVSMGGYGSLRFGFTHPDVFAGLAAMEPALDPVYEPAELQPRNMMLRGVDAREISDQFPPAHGTAAAECEAMFGAVSPRAWDADAYQAYNPASIARSNAQVIREHGLKIYVEVGDRDMFNLHEGAEFLHQTLWKHRIAHEYHLWTEADHLGSTMMPRMTETFTWLGKMMRKAMDPPCIEPTPGQVIYLKWLDENKVTFPTPDMQLPEGAEPIGFIHDTFVEWMRGRMSSYLTEYYDHFDGWGRLPEATVRRTKQK